MRPLSQVHKFSMVDYVMLSIHQGYPIIDEQNIYIKLKNTTTIANIKLLNDKK